jgi:DNA-binding NarL/FixJ family response regulator
MMIRCPPRAPSGEILVTDGIEATRRLAGPGSADPVKILVVTTFNVDEYVYEALKAGASGFLLKDAPPTEHW